MNESPHSQTFPEGAALSANGAPPRPWLRRTAPQALVFAALAGVAYWGHHTGWSMSAAASLLGRATQPTPEWCDAHSVLDAECIECNPELLPRAASHGWCKQHGIHECPLCFPDVVQLKTAPQFTAADRQRASRALAAGERARNNSKCQLYLRRIQFASADAVEKAGIEGADRRVDLGQRRVGLRPDALGAPFVSPAGHGLARRKRAWRSSRQRRRFGAGRRRGSRPRQGRFSTGPGSGRSQATELRAPRGRGRRPAGQATARKRLGA